MKFANSNVLILILFISNVLSSGCTYQSGYNPGYMPDEDPQFISDGSVFLLIPEDQANFEYNESPTSYHGSATKYSIPLGTILREVSAEVLRDRFAGGVAFTSDSSVTSRCCVTFAPLIMRLDYRYSGWDVDLSIELDLHVEILDKSGDPFFSHTYESGIVQERVEGPSRTMPVTPNSADRFNALVHWTIYELLEKAFSDANQLIIQQL